MLFVFLFQLYLSDSTSRNSLESDSEILTLYHYDTSTLFED